MRFLNIFFFIFFITSCGNKKTATAENDGADSAAVVNDTLVVLTPAQKSNAAIVSAKISQKPMTSVLQLSGVIDVPPQNIVSISVPLGGYLKSSKLLPGMHVNKGETIAVMEDPQYIELQQDYLTTKAKLAYAEQEYNRQKELNASKASSDKVFQQARTEYNTQQVLLRSLAEKLKLIHINPAKLSSANISRYVSVPSPIDGFVSRVNANIGKYTSPSDILFEIINPEDIHLAIEVFEKDINKLKQGQKIWAYTNVDPDKKYPCEIILISKNYSEDRTVTVHCHFLSYDKALIPGTFMKAEVELKEHPALVVPADAVVSYEEKHFVFVDKGANQFALTPVKVGNTHENEVEIIADAGNALQDKNIVVSGAYTLLMKMKNTSDE